MNFFNKLTSRKFWIAVTNFVTQLLYFFNFAESEVEKVTALIMASAGLIAYIIGEGLADSCNTNIQNYEQPFPMNPPIAKEEIETVLESKTLSKKEDTEKLTLESLDKRVKALEEYLLDLSE